MPRTPPEWIAKSDDARIPPRVRIRVFERFGGICQLTGRKIMPGDEWDCDHAVALANGGQHREANLRPILRSAHREKTKADVAEKSRVNRKRAKHLGVTRPAGKLQSRGFTPAPPQQRARKPLGKSLPPRVDIFSRKEIRDD